MWWGGCGGVQAWRSRDRHSKTGLPPLSVLDPAGESCTKGLAPNGFPGSRALINEEARYACYSCSNP